MADHCSSCKQEIRWAVTAGGHRMPVDPELVPDGNLRLEPAPNGRTPRVVVVPPAQRVDGELLYKPHWATCPFAEQHRRRR